MLRDIRKVGLLVRKQKKPISFGPHQRITIIKPRETTADKRDVHKALLKNELEELQDGWGQTGTARFLAQEVHDVKITPGLDTP